MKNSGIVFATPKKGIVSSMLSHRPLHRTHQWDLVSIPGRDKDNDVAHEVFWILLFLGASFIL